MFRRPAVPFGWKGYLAWLAVRGTVVAAARAAWWLCSRPSRLATVVACAAVVWCLRAFGPPPLSLGTFAVCYALATWSQVWPASFDAWIEYPVRAWWRRRLVYTSRRWRHAMLLGELVAAGPDDAPVLPTIRRVRCSPAGDLVEVRSPVGLRWSRWEDAEPMLAHVFRAAECFAHQGDDRRLSLELPRRDGRGRSWGRP